MQYLKKYKRSHAPSIFNDSITFVDEVLDSFLGSYQASINCNEDDNSYKFDMELPGFSKQQVNISVKDKTLSISANNKKLKKQRSKEITIPSDSDIDNIQAKLENGILTITIGKLEQNNLKSIKVS